MNTKITVAFLAVVAFTFTTAAEVVKEIDATEKYYVVFAVTGTSPGSAIVVMGKGRSAKKMKVDTAYGLIVKNGAPAMDTVSARKIKEVRGKKGENETHSLVVRVSADQYKKAKEVVVEWSARESLQHSPLVSATDFAVDVAKQLGLKMPYRTGLGQPNPILFYNDLFAINR